MPHRRELITLVSVLTGAWDQINSLVDPKITREQKYLTGIFLRNDLIWRAPNCRIRVGTPLRGDRNRVSARRLYNGGIALLMGRSRLSWLLMVDVPVRDAGKFIVHEARDLAR